MDRLRFLERRFDVEIELAPTTIHALLTRGHGESSVIRISTLLDRERQLAAAATMLHVIARGWSGRQHAFMFPRSDDGPEVVRHLLITRRSYRGPYRDGLRSLMPDDWMEAQERDEVDPRVSAEEARVSLTDYFFRTVDWLAHRRTKPKGLQASVDWLLAHKHIKRASELPPRPPRRPRVYPPQPAPWVPSLLDPSTRSAGRATIYRELYGAWRANAGRFD
jgi:hypothetical protein